MPFKLLNNHIRRKRVSYQQSHKRSRSDNRDISFPYMLSYPPCGTLTRAALIDFKWMLFQTKPGMVARSAKLRTAVDSLLIFQCSTQMLLIIQQLATSIRQISLASPDRIRAGSGPRTRMVFPHVDHNPFNPDTLREKGGLTVRPHKADQRYKMHYCNLCIRVRSSTRM